MSAYERKRLLLATAVFALAVGFAVARVGFVAEVAGVRLSAAFVMHDFYITAYYPLRAYLEGQSPYDLYYPPFAPTHLLLHLPFALLPPRPAGVAYFLITVLLTILLSRLVLRLVRVEADSARILFLAAAILLSRPGQWSLLVGQMSIPLTLMAYVTLLWGRSNPTIAGWALSVTLCKPTYGVPLALLLWAWGRRKAMALGVILATILNLPLIALLAAREGGLRQLLSAASIANQDLQNMVNPLRSHGRTDATSLISRFVGAPISGFEQVLVTAAVLVLSAAVLRLLAKDATQNADALAIGIICLATSLVGYHQGYDLVLLSAPFVAAAVPGSFSEVPRGLRATIIALFSILALNWISTESVIAAWQPSRSQLLGITSINGLCVVGLFLSYLILGVRYHARSQASSAPDSINPELSKS